MSNLIDYLREQSTTDCVAYTEFMLSYKKGEDSLYCFFEGFEDIPYYSVRIENNSSFGTLLSFICGGKDEVLKVHALINSNPYYCHAKAGFFVDKDFDSIEHPRGVYVTPTYSIENLYCCQKSFEHILLSEFRMKRKDIDFIKCVSTYKELQDFFNKSTLLLNSWLACQADYRNENKINTRLSIDKKVKPFFDKIVSPDLSQLKSFPEFETKEKIEEIFTDSPTVPNDIFYKKVGELNSVNQVDQFRGKFLLRFLESFLCRLQSVFGMDYSPFEKKYSCCLRFEYSTLCSILSPFAITPKCLKEYIRGLKN